LGDKLEAQQILKNIKSNLIDKVELSLQEVQSIEKINPIKKIMSEMPGNNAAKIAR
jgi:signal recognition particle GTPase